MTAGDQSQKASARARPAKSRPLPPPSGGRARCRCHRNGVQTMCIGGGEGGVRPAMTSHGTSPPGRDRCTLMNVPYSARRGRLSARPAPAPQRSARAPAARGAYLGISSWILRMKSDFSAQPLHASPQSSRIRRSSLTRSLRRSAVLRSICLSAGRAEPRSAGGARPRCRGRRLRVRRR